MDEEEGREEAKVKKRVPGQKKRVVLVVFSVEGGDSLSLRAGERVGATGADGKRSGKK